MTLRIADRYVTKQALPATAGSPMVMEALDEVSFRTVALHLFGRVPQTELTRRVFEDRFRQLISMVHPNVVRVLDSGFDCELDRYFLVEESAPSGYPPLVKSVTSPLAWDDFYERIGAPVADALAYAHSRGVVHGEIEAENVYLGRRGVKLGSFGLRELSALQMEQASGVGSERLEAREAASFRQDVADFALLAVSCLVGNLAIPSAGAPSQLEALNLEPAVAEVFESALAKSPKGRLVNAEVLAVSLRNVQRARLRTAGRRNRVSVKLTRRVADQINESSEEDFRSAPEVVTEDLADNVLAGYRLDYNYTPPRRVQSEIELRGARFSYLAKIPPEGDSLHLVNARALDDDPVSRSNAWMWETTCSFRAGDPTNTARAKDSLAYFEEQLRAHADRFDDLQDERHADALIQEWGRQLDAKTQVQEDLQSPIRYESVELTGNRARFTVVESPTEDLLRESRLPRPDEARRGRIMAGEIIEIEEDAIILLLEDSTTALSGPGSLIRDTTASTKAIDYQKRALDAVRWGNRGIVRPELKDLILDPSRSTMEEPVEPDRWFSDGLDEDKRRSVRRAIAANDFFILQGPPGTGKTQFIAELVAQTLASNPSARILVTSQTHVALDNALERIEHLLPDTRMTRLGDFARGSIAQGVKHLTLNHQLEAWRDEVRERSEQATEALALQEGVTVEAIRAALRASRVVARALERDAVQRALDEHAAALASSSALGDQQGKVLTADEERETKEKRTELATRLKRIRVEMDELAQGVGVQLGLGGRSPSTMSHSDLMGIRNHTVQAIPGWERWRQIVDLQDEWLDRLRVASDFERAFLRGRSVVAATCVGLAGYRSLESLEFDLCIFDEASKADATETLVPLVRSRKWVLVGDENQLPPFQEQALLDQDFLQSLAFDLDKDELRRTLFTRLVDSLPERNQEMLRHQYRMVPEIGNLISKCFYGGRLVTVERARPPMLDLAMPHAVSWLDTSASPTRREERAGPSSKSFVNPHEAQKVIDWICELDQSLGKYGCTERFELLCLSCYQPQKFAIVRNLNPVRPQLCHLDVSVSTVDAVQGREADIVAFSITRSNVGNDWGFMRFDPRINVALSRGRFGLVILGDRTFAGNAGAGLSRVARFLERQDGGLAMNEVSEVQLRRRFGSSVPGFELVGIEPCALPMSQIALDIVVQRKKPLPALEEYVLRTVEIGTNSVRSVAALLGLSPADVLDTALVLQQSGNLEITWEPQSASEDVGADPDVLLHITEAGCIAARELTSLVPESHEISVVFDRLTWQVVATPLGHLTPKRTVQTELLLPSQLSRTPTDVDVTFADIEQLIHSFHWLQSGRGGSDLLRFSSVDHGAKNKYLLAKLLVFKAREGDELHLSVLVDDRVDPKRDRALAELGGAEALGIVIDTPRLAPNELPAEVINRVASTGLVSALRSEIHEALADLDADPPDGPPAADVSEQGTATRSPEEAGQKFLAAEASLGSISVRRIDTYEHADLLQAAIKGATTRLLIISPWVTTAVVSDEFVGHLESRCQAGVRVHIGYGIDREDRDNRHDRTAVERLEALASTYPNMTLVRLGDTHAKVLIWDASWVSTSFNWLSFRGDRNRSYRQEEGILVTDPALVNQNYREMLVRFGEEPEPRSDWAVKTATLPGPDPAIVALIGSDESKVLEFKSSARWNILKKGQDNAIELAIVKTVAAFMNSDGGTLIIGVNDDGEVVGLNNDYKLFPKKGRDQFENWLTTLWEKTLGRPPLAYLDVSFHEFEEGDVCCVSVRRSPSVVYVSQGDTTDVYMRGNNTTRKLTTREAVQYVKEHWAGA